jgi:lysophospholipase L1-like esterase
MELTIRTNIELGPNQNIVFTGDSITDTNRLEPAYRPFGYGYVNFVANHLLAKYPELDLNIINTGISGNTVRDLHGRWERDCIRYNPDTLSVLIGINDVWRQFAEPEKLPQAVYPQEYELTYRQLVSRAKQRCNCQLVLMEPFMFCNNPQDSMFEGLQTYISVVHQLANEFDAVLVPLQSKVNEQIKHVPQEKWSMDMVHPYVWAHAWIARQWLEATGL